MSYVLAANKFDSRNIRQSERDAPFSFFNTLQYPLIVEKDSEIAVASVKINKTDSITIDEDMSFFQYFGVPLNSGNPSIQLSTSRPKLVRPVFEDSDMKQKNMTPERLADRIGKGMRQAIFNPVCNMNDTFIQCKTDINASGAFTGFGFVYSQDATDRSGDDTVQADRQIISERS